VEQFPVGVGEAEAMMIKDILVHLDGSAEDEVRLAHGEAVASAQGAHLTGIFTNPLPELLITTPMDGGAATAQVLAEIEQQARLEGDTVNRRLSERLARLGVSNELRRVEATPGGLSAAVASQARCADLFVATRPYREAGAPLWDELIEAVLFGSGRGLLLVPPERPPQGRPVASVLVAWNQSREAARAVREALSFIEKATRTVILLVDPEPDDAIEPGIAKHLLRHGAAAEIANVEGRGHRVGEVILDEAGRVSADLVVMGGYGHARLRERVFGGATLEMLTASEYPILMAH
jgi:nucleotide-binding universal stress UspA family protein